MTSDPSRGPAVVPLLAMLTSLLWAEGCFSVTSVVAQDGLVQLREREATQPAARPSSSAGGSGTAGGPTVSVHVQAVDELGCVLVEPPADHGGDDGRADFECIAFFVAASQAEEQIERQAEEVDGAMGLHVQGFTQVLVELLQGHLESRSLSAVVASGPARGAATETRVKPVLTYAQTGRMFGYKLARVTLTATSVDGRKLRAVGTGREELGQDNLGWYLPFAILLPPLGGIFGRMILDDMEADRIALSLVLAIDEAAAHLAGQLVAAAAESDGETRQWSLSATMRLAARP